MTCPRGPRWRSGAEQDDIGCAGWGATTLTTPDLARQVAYYTEVVGLTLVERDSRRAILATRQGLEAIALEPGAPNALARLAFQVAPGTDLAEVIRALQKHGVASERRSGISPGVAEAVVFKDAKGTDIEAFSDILRRGRPGPGRHQDAARSSGTLPTASTTCSGW